MREKVGSALLLLAFATAAQAQIKLPAKIEVATNRVVEIEADLVGDDVDFSQSDGFYVIRGYSRDPKRVKLAVVAYDQPGEFKLTAFAARSVEGVGVLSKTVSTVVVTSRAPPIDPDFGAAPKSIGLSLAFGPWSKGSETGSIATVTGTAKITGGDPPGPGPGPGPNPPPPADPLVTEIKATNTPAAVLSKIATAFKAVPTVVTVGRTAVVTQQATKKVLAEMIGDDVIPKNLHVILMRELNTLNATISPSEPDDLITADDKAAITKVYTRIALALEAAK